MSGGRHEKGSAGFIRSSRWVSGEWLRWWRHPHFSCHHIAGASKWNNPHHVRWKSKRIKPDGFWRNGPLSLELGRRWRLFSTGRSESVKCCNLGNTHGYGIICCDCHRDRFRVTSGAADCELPHSDHSARYPFDHVDFTTERDSRCCLRHWPRVSGHRHRWSDALYLELDRCEGLFTATRPEPF